MDVFCCCRSLCIILNFTVFYCFFSVLLIVIKLFIFAICAFYGEEVFPRMVNFVFYPKSVTSPHFPPILLGSLCSLLTCYIFFLRSIFGKVLYAHNKIRNSPRLSLRGWPPRRASLLRLPPLPPSHFSQKRTQLRQRAKEPRQLNEKEKDTERKKIFFLSRQIGSPRQPRATVVPRPRPDPAPGRPARTPRRPGENPGRSPRTVHSKVRTPRDQTRTLFPSVTTLASLLCLQSIFGVPLHVFIFGAKATSISLSVATEMQYYSCAALLINHHIFTQSDLSLIWR